MIDLDKVEQSVKNLMRMYPESTRATQSIGEVCELIKTLRQAEKDAARYRWLRDESAFTHENAPLTFFTDTNGDQIAFDFNGSSYSVLHDEMLDAAIDEAMQCK